MGANIRNASNPKGVIMDGYLACEICEHYPYIPEPVKGEDHTHHQVICIHCGIEVNTLSSVTSKIIWNTLMK